MQGVPGITAHPGHAPTITYYALKYTASAPPGLPPVVQANWVTIENADDGNYVRFFLTPPATSSTTEPICVLRIRRSHLAEYGQHERLFDALTAG